MQAPTSGRIISFHAYKGGAGTSSTLANAAWMLASAGKKVLAVDWDLGAPSLHRFFRPFLIDAELASTEGLLDAALAYSTSSAPANGLESYLVSVDWDFPDQGALDLLPAGRQDPGYAQRALSFAWNPFLSSPGGAAFVQALRNDLRSQYDYVLIDTTCGIRDLNDTLALPDILCLCLMLNRQSIAGCQQMAEIAARQRVADPLRIFPIVMRVDPAEMQLLSEQRAMARSALGPYLAHLGAQDAQQQYWRDTEFPYVPFHSYGEVLPIFMDRAGDQSSLSSATERLCRYLTDGAVTSFAYPPESGREDVLARYK